MIGISIVKDIGMQVSGHNQIVLDSELFDCVEAFIDLGYELVGILNNNIDVDLIFKNNEDEGFVFKILYNDDKKPEAKTKNLQKRDFKELYKQCNLITNKVI